MINKYSNRREFLKYAKLLSLYLLTSCSNSSQRTKIAFQDSLYPEPFKDTIPKYWGKIKLNLGDINTDKFKREILNSDLTLINDGWINKINLEIFQDINKDYFLGKLDKRSKDFLSTYEENQRNKIFPIGVVPYAVIIKNNKDLIYSAEKSWDFLLSRKLTKKIIFPKSPRILISISEKIKLSNSLSKLKRQAMLFDDQNILNWLINSDAIVAIVPYSLCSKYFKIDSRLSVVFPKEGVPLMWHFILSRSDLRNDLFINWLKSLKEKSIVDKLSKQGWYLPFKDNYIQSKYKSEKSLISGPSEQCWANSWSFPKLSNQTKINLENIWNK